MNIFESENFRDILKTCATERNLPLRQIALQTQIHPSYFSRVMTGNAVFSPEQIYRIVHLFGFDKVETDYMLLLIEYEASADKLHRQFTQRKIKELRQSQLQLVNRLSSEQAIRHSPETDQTTYYEDIMIAMVHMHLTIDSLRKQPVQVQNLLGLSAKRFNEILHKLERLDLIERKGEQVLLKKNFVHLDPQHPISVQNHVNWRLHAIQNLAARDKKPDDYHLSVAISADPDAKEKIKEAIVRLALEIEAIVKKAKSEAAVYYLGFDLYE